MLFRSTDLERFVFDGTQLIARERLLDGIGRVRDIEVDALGQIHLLIEHREGSRILRLAPRTEQPGALGGGQPRTPVSNGMTRRA